MQGYGEIMMTLHPVRESHNDETVQIKFAVMSAPLTCPVGLHTLDFSQPERITVLNIIEMRPCTVREIRA